MAIIKDKYNPEDFDYEEILKNVRKGMIEQREEYRKLLQTNPDPTDEERIDIVLKVTDPLENILNSFIYANTNICVFVIIHNYILEHRNDLDQCMKEIMLNLIGGIDESIEPLKERIAALESKKLDIESMINKLKEEDKDD